MFSQPLDEPFAARFDQQPGLETEVDLGWCGEDAEGIWFKVHPQTAFLEFPELWEPVARYMAGDNEVKATDVDTLSAFDLAVKATLQAASNKRYSPKEPDDNE